MLYADKLLQVVWIEPLPDVFQLLQHNIRMFSSQLGINALVGEHDGEKIKLHVSPGTRAASSIFPIKEVTMIWPDVSYESEITLVSRTLPSLLKEHRIDLADYKALVMDTQGSELLILRGAESILHNFDYIKLEAANFEIYEGCALLEDIQIFLAEHGFEESSRYLFAAKGERQCYDVVFKKRGLRRNFPFRLPLARPKAIRNLDIVEQ